MCVCVCVCVTQHTKYKLCITNRSTRFNFILMGVCHPEKRVSTAIEYDVHRTTHDSPTISAVCSSAKVARCLV